MKCNALFHLLFQLRTSNKNAFITSHQSRTKNVPLSIRLISMPTHRTMSRKRKKREKERDNLRVNFVDAIKTIG